MNNNHNIPHILDNPPKPEKELAFTHEISPVDGSLQHEGIHHVQPSQWDNVRHLVGNLYYVWDTDSPLHGSVFLGEFN